MKRYEISYANQVLHALAAAASAEGTVEMSVRQVADETELSASAVQLGLQALRRAGRVVTLRKGAAGRPSVIQVRSAKPIEGTESSADGRGGSHLADAFIKRYEELLIDLHAKREDDDVERLRRRVAELEAENTELRETLARLADLVGQRPAEESA
ncbi:MAG: hypothetical protein IT198_04105 [Acidimicrobiia bacterium]|nr:hypothetical protein [Acidimicrobiia bacterium]